MHAWIFQLSEERIEGYLCEDTLLQGNGCDYDYLRKSGREPFARLLMTYCHWVCFGSKMKRRWCIKVVSSNGNVSGWSVFRRRL